MEILIFALKSMVLGIIEGLTEFLPVSSTGHLVIFQNLLKFNEEAVTKGYVDMYTYVIQLGAILAVIVLYFGKIKETVIHLFPSEKVSFEKSGIRFWLIIVIACIPGGVLGVLFDDLAEEKLFKPVPVAIALILGGILMIIMENKFRNKRNKTTEISVTIKQAIIIGVFQCLAIIPGMSRSASTIMGGWVSGLSTVVATEFSFFLAIPVMLGMSTLKILKMGSDILTMTSGEVIALGVGFIVAFIVALFAIEKFINFLKKKKMRVFAVYRFFFAIVVILAGVFKLF